MIAGVIGSLTKLKKL